LAWKYLSKLNSLYGFQTDIEKIDNIPLYGPATTPHLNDLG